MLSFRDYGDHAFSRYEDGKTKPPLGLVKLLKVLDRHPDPLDKVKVAQHCAVDPGIPRPPPRSEKPGLAHPAPGCVFHCSDII